MSYIGNRRSLLNGNRSPSLDLNFLTGQLDSRITFTRASGATYFDATGTLQSAANNVPRFDYGPSPGAQPLGLLIEESRTNMLLQSANITTPGGWTTSAALTGNYATAPDGTTTASLYTETTGGSQTLCARTVTLAATTAYTQSLFIKQSPFGSQAYIGVLFGGSAIFGSYLGAIFNPNTGAVVFASGGVTTTTQSVGNGWYRVSATATTTTGGSASISWRIGTSTSDIFQTAVGDGVSGVLPWGAQMEAGAFVTSYIPTTTTTATRANEQGTMYAIGPVLGQGDLTIAYEAMYTVLPTSGAHNFYQLMDGGPNVITLYNQIGQGFVYQIAVAGGVTQLNGDLGNDVFTIGVPFKHAFKATNAGLMTEVWNGVQSGTRNGKIKPTGMTQLNLGGGPLGGYVRRWRGWSRGLSGPEMIAVTR